MTSCSQGPHLIYRGLLAKFAIMILIYFGAKAEISGTGIS